MRKGKFALLLHAHLPYVRHPEHADFLEEDWFYEAIVETYLPLLRVFERLAAERAPVRVTISITPTLGAMMEDPLLRERAARHLDRSVALAESEVSRMAGDTAARGLAEFYLKRFRETRDDFSARGGRLIPAFRSMQDAGVLELITCAATHGFLPLMAGHPEAIRAQILTACDYHRELFGRKPSGIWLPECGYFPGLGNYLVEADLKWFVLDAHGLMFGKPSVSRRPTILRPASSSVFAISIAWRRPSKIFVCESGCTYSRAASTRAFPSLFIRVGRSTILAFVE